MRQTVLIVMSLLMLVLSVVALPRPLKQAKIRRGDDDYDGGYDDDHHKHKPSKIYYPPYPTPTHYYP
jgi:hypothetical protein